MREDDRKEFSRFLEEFQGETDRGAALVGTALIDEQLKNILATFFSDRKSSSDLLEGFNAPLGTLNSRIKAAHALGLVDDYEFKECEIIRKIRNEFAHKPHGLAFTTETVRSLADSLESHSPDGTKFNGNARLQFVNAVIMLVLRFSYRDRWVVSEKREVKTWPYDR